MGCYKDLVNKITDLINTYGLRTVMSALATVCVERAATVRRDILDAHRAGEPVSGRSAEAMEFRRVADSLEMLNMFHHSKGS